MNKSLKIQNNIENNINIIRNIQEENSNWHNIPNIYLCNNNNLENFPKNNVNNINNLGIDNMNIRKSKN